MRGSLFFKQLLRDNRGATAIEYGLIVAMIGLAIMVTMQAMAGEIIEMWGFVEVTATDAMD